jgi:type I restriction enzyme, S subunit
MEVREASARYLVKLGYSCPPGYKQTEVGMIPEDWNPEKLGTHATFRTGPFGSALHQSDYVDDGVPVINPMQIIGGKIAATTSMSISEPMARRLSDFRLAEGEVVIGRRGEMGRCAVVQSTQSGWLCGTGSMIIRCKTSLDPQYAQRVLSSPQVIAAIENTSVGSTMINLNQGTLSNLLIPVPPQLAEQQAIAEALSDADALIESLDQLLAKKRQIKQGAMQELLTGQKRLPGFSGEWETRSFDGVLQRINAKDHQIPTGDYQPIGVCPVVDQGKARVVAFSDLEDRRFKCPAQGAIVFGDHTCIIKFVDFDFLVGADGTQVLVAKEGECTRFHAFQLEYDGIQPTGYNRHFSLLKEREFLVPTVPEQTAIATVLSDLDAEIAALEARLAKARLLKQGMMQELLTGRIRLV